MKDYETVVTDKGEMKIRWINSSLVDQAIKKMIENIEKEDIKKVISNK